MMRVGEAEIEAILDKLPQAISLRQLARDVGIDPQTFRHLVAPYVAVMRAQGALAPCPCGKERFHPYACAHRTKPKPPGGKEGLTGAALEAALHRRQLFVSLLVSGARFSEIDAAMGTSKGTAIGMCRHLTEEQRRQRAEAVAERDGGAK